MRAGIRAVLSSLGYEAELTLGDTFVDRSWPEILERVGPETALMRTLGRWCATNAGPRVLLIDEVDSLVGDTLISVLRELRTGYADRPECFPHSVVLCGVRDVRDYRIRFGSTNEVVLVGSAFNIKTESIRLGDFARDEVLALLGQHTEATGQAFTKNALAAIWNLTHGQPWLVNALARTVCFENGGALDRRRAVTSHDVQSARESLILRCDTH